MFLFKCDKKIWRFNEFFLCLKGKTNDPMKLPTIISTQDIKYGKKLGTKNSIYNTSVRFLFLVNYLQNYWLFLSFFLKKN